ncbi:heat-inducible transcription repressor HrcA [Canibacter sp. lx-72]|uniref:heat-inducible transcriptional repressor HrcA n=1 Tax=Canibacter zhuwentaonis TaxID=2837491 RepID=UPI001BDDBED5|nr:heat-inducible transcriptional repressor HrcA [Canibacter zhuwentaonis]MBT1017898.1 heat-inducible transcription repressor HrcA [Canibacter zhuwentaonis]MBT1035061.1 heat-inducible transcription repressor HrcA [Canibacter zhuwentaonis]
MVSERSLQVLRAIVNDYVVHHEPVGSKRIVQKYAFDVSAATIRSDMMALEKAGLITAPHTSSGRVPTDKGYRLHVDTLTRLQPLSAAKKLAIERFLGETHDLDEVLNRTARILSLLTNQVALIQYPGVPSERVRHFDLVQLSANRVLAILVKSSGVVAQQLIVFNADELRHLSLPTVRGQIYRAIIDKDLKAALATLAAEYKNIILPQLPPVAKAPAAIIFDSVCEQLAVSTAAKLKVSGTANISRAAVAELSAEVVLEALEEQVTLLQLFNEFALQQEREISISIGRENETYGLQGTAVLATSYGNANSTGSQLGVIGSLHMDYAENIVAVQAVASYLNKILS